MATLKFQNKYQVTFNKLVKEGMDIEGKPASTDVSGKEAWDILNVIRLVGTIGFHVEPGSYDPTFMLRSSAKAIERDVAADLINRWFRREFEVFFKYKIGGEKIPVKVIPAKKKAVTKTITVDVKPKETVDKTTNKDDNTQ